MPSDLAQPCLRCIETLTAWTDELNYATAQALENMVRNHPITPYKSWQMTGRGGVEIITDAYRCSRCGNSWRSTRRA